MSEYAKIATTHLRRTAVVYVRQSSASQLERNLESTDRQYALVERAVALGWPRGSVRVIDADLGVSGSRARPAGAGTAHHPESRARRVPLLTPMGWGSGMRCPAASVPTRGRR